MHLLQLLFRAGPGVLLLVLCLQLGTNKAQEDNRTVIKMNLQMPQVAKENEEVTLKLTIGTELRECMVIKTFLRGSHTMDGPFNYNYTACLCEDYPRTFYWDFEVNRTMAIAAMVHIIEKEGICPNKAVVPNGQKYFYTTQGIQII
ncbi:prolactin-inducible protein [Halichoerus grypus]|uniref:prolactin-inducible protein n=1 Tax=Phoca vitulina TaxID=9720 RepID=UPI0013964E88|nr:prolactin-inducible protein [Phoca vitulina]XP_035951722.1 prolactin-inducible protein [Halichoerus grypus]